MKHIENAIRELELAVAEIDAGGCRGCGDRVKKQLVAQIDLLNHARLETLVS